MTATNVFKFVQISVVSGVVPCVLKSTGKLASLEEWKCIILSVRSSGSAFCRNSQRTKGRTCRSREELVQWIDCTMILFVFRMLSISSIIIFC